MSNSIRTEIGATTPGGTASTGASANASNGTAVTTPVVPAAGGAEVANTTATQTSDASPTATSSLDNIATFDFSSLGIAETPDPINSLPVDDAAKNVDADNPQDNWFQEALNKALGKTEVKNPDTEPLAQVVQLIEIDTDSQVEDLKNKKSEKGDKEGRNVDADTELSNRFESRDKFLKKNAKLVGDKAAEASKKGNEELGRQLKQQANRLSSAREKMTVAYELGKQEASGSEMREKAKNFQKMAGEATPKKATPEQAAAAKAVVAAKVKANGGEFKAADAPLRQKAVAKANAPVDTKSADKTAEPAKKTTEAQKPAEKTTEAARKKASETVAEPTDKDIQKSEAAVKAAVDPQTREDRLQSRRERDDKVRQTRIALSRASKQSTPDGTMEAGAEAVFSKKNVEQEYEQAHRHAWNDLFKGGASTLNGLVNFDGSVARAAQEGQLVDDKGIPGVHTAANFPEMNAENAPGRLAELVNKSKSDFNDTPTMTVLTQWKSWSERPVDVARLKATDLGQVNA